VIQTFTYDSAARLLQTTTTNNGAYTRNVYGPTYVQSFSTVNTVADEAYSIQNFDGASRVISAASNHPGSQGGYRGQTTAYDLMGRMIKQSNPTEISSKWVPKGDDVAGWVYTQQTYDWKARPLVTTNTDGAQKSASYSACGCAGSEVTTLTDEMGRRQKIYSDVLGRAAKTEILNWNSTVYSTTANTYNALDQVTRVREYQGADTSTTHQDTTATFDGWGRLKTRHLPEQQVDPNIAASTDHTTWDYNNDDTIQKITDARGASASYSYNNRHLTTGITYAVPAGSNIPVTPNVSFAYDAVGNRISMTDGSGSVSYSFDQLSRVTSEARTFVDFSGSYPLNYTYNLANELTSLSVPFTSQQVGYNYDAAGRLSGVTASGFSATYYGGSGPPQTQTLTTFLSNINYRAWGGRKSMTYGNTVSDAISYNARLQPTSYTLSNVNYTNYTASYPFPTYSSMSWTFDYYNDGRQHHAWDSTNNWFDRSYAYDHAGRLSEATTYRRAEGLSPFPAVPNLDPYYQTMSYDVWNHLSRSGMLYVAGLSDLGNYTNNRCSQWSYDADGNVTRDVSYQHTFDAAGRSSEAVSIRTVGDGTTQFPTQPEIEITQNYDGDGQSGKRVQIMRQNIYDELNEQHPLMQVMEDNQTSYYVRSSVLGGARVMELKRDWQGSVYKESLWIYAGGQRIAIEGGGSVAFQHNNPANGSWATSLGHSAYRTTERQERDPMGAELPLSNPYAGMTYINLKWQEPLFIEGGDPFDYSGGHEIDGMPVSNAEFARRTGNGSVGGGIFVNGTQVGFVDLSGGLRNFTHISITFDRFLVNGADPELPTYWLESFNVDLEVPGSGNPQDIVGGATFINCMHSAGLDTKRVSGQDLQYADATHFTPEAADLLLKVNKAEGTSLSLLAVTLMNENTSFDLYEKPNTLFNPKTGKDAPRNWWDVGPFQLNQHYINQGIANKRLSMDDLDYGGVFGMKMDKDQRFGGDPLQNGRMAARHLNTIGSNDRARAVAYAGQAKALQRGQSYDSFASLFETFFNCCR
jgi:YD repeat-containing protein